MRREEVRRSVRRCRVRKALGCLVVALAIMGKHSDAQAAPLLSIVPSPATVAIGDSFSVSVDVTDAVDLFAFQFGLQFDPLVLNATAILEGDFLSAGGATDFFPGFIDNVTGAITFSLAALVGPVSGVSGSGRLLSIEFIAAGSGMSPIVITLDPLNADGLLDSTLSPILDVGLQGGQALVGPAVPEPATICLLAAGVAALARRRRRPLGNNPGSLTE